MYGLKSGPNEGTNIGEDDLIENDFAFPKFVDSLELEKDDVIMEPVMMPNKQQRRQEILDIVTKANLNFTVKTADAAGLVSIGKVLGSRVIFNFLSILPSIDIANKPVMPFEEFSDKDVYSNLEYFYDSIKASKGAISAWKGASGSAITVPKNSDDDMTNSPATVSSMADLENHLYRTYALNNCQGKAIKDIERVHAVVYSLSKLEETYSLGIFKKGGSLHQKLIQNNPISAITDSLENAVFNFASGLHPLAVILSSIGGVGSMKVRFLSGVISKVSSFLPNLNKKDYIMAYLGVKTFGEAYQYIINTDIPSNLNNYYFSSGSLQVKTRDVFNETVKSISANIVYGSTLLGRLLGDAKGVFSEVVENVSEYINPPENMIDSDQITEKQLEAMPNITEYIINDGSLDRYYVWTGKMEDLAGIMENKVRKNTYDRLDPKTSFSFTMTNFDAAYIKACLRYLSGFLKDHGVESDILELESGSKSVGDLGSVQYVKSIRAVSLSNETGITSVMPIIKVSDQNYSSFIRREDPNPGANPNSTTESLNKKFYIVKDLLAVDFNNVQYPEGVEIYFYEKSGMFAGAYRVSSDYLTEGNASFSLIAKDDSVPAPNIPSIKNPRAAYASYNYIRKRFIRKEKMTDFESEVSQGLLQFINDQNGDLKIRVDQQGIDSATVLYYLIEYARSRNLVNEKRMQRKVNKF